MYTSFLIKKQQILIFWIFFHFNKYDVYRGIIEGIYIEQPLGFIDDNDFHVVCLILKSLYSLYQFAQCWSHTFASWLKAHEA